MVVFSIMQTHNSTRISSVEIGWFRTLSWLCVCTADDASIWRSRTHKHAWLKPSADGRILLCTLLWTAVTPWPLIYLFHSGILLYCLFKSDTLGHVSRLPTPCYSAMLVWRTVPWAHFVSGTRWTWQQGDEWTTTGLLGSWKALAIRVLTAHGKPHFPRVVQVSQNRQPFSTPAHKNCESHHSHLITTTERTTRANSAWKTIEPVRGLKTPPNPRGRWIGSSQVRSTRSQKQWENLAHS